MPVTSMLEAYGIIRGPRHHVRGAGWHHLVTAGAAIVLVGGSARDLPDVPVTIRMTLAALPTQGIQRTFVIAIVIDASILAAHR